MRALSIERSILTTEVNRLAKYPRIGSAIVGSVLSGAWEGVRGPVHRTTYTDRTRLVDRLCRARDHDNQVTTRRRLKHGAGRCESRSRSPAACISDFTLLRGGDPPRHAVAIPSRNACRAARSASRRGRHSAVLLLGGEIPGSRHSRAWRKAHHRDRPHGPVSLQPEPDLSGVLRVSSSVSRSGSTACGCWLRSSGRWR